MQHFIFIIWNKALWCKKRILCDIKQSFPYVKTFEIKWNTNMFESNLESFYGIKLPNNSEKMKHCGNGKFLLIVVGDENPNYQSRKTTDGVEYVNSNMFDKKSLYRQWTGGGHRIHCSNTELETLHDLELLLGVLPSQIDQVFPEDNYVLERNLTGTNGFSSSEEFEKLLNCMYETIWSFEQNEYVIVTRCREDIRRVVFAEKSENGVYSITISGQKVNAYVFGELDGDIDSKMFEEIKKKGEIVPLLRENYKEYSSILWDNQNNEKVLNKLKENDWVIQRNNVDLIKTIKKPSLAKRIVRGLKYIMARIQNLWK